MKYNSIGQQLIAKAKELDPNYKPDKFNDMSEALNIILNNYATFNDLYTLDIGAITSSSNIYQTLYQNVYENDTTKKNVVIFSTEGFVDSATSLISSGEHIATPYQDNKILIDSVFVLNSDNSATSIVSSDTVIIDLGTLEGESGTLSPTILSKINNAISENKHFVIKTNIGFDIIFPNVLYTAGANLYATGFIYSITELIAGNILIDLSNGQYMIGNFEIQEKLVSGTNIKTVNEQSLLGTGNIAVQEPLVSGTNIKTVNGQTLLSSGNIAVQEPLVSGTNIKTVNGNSLLGSGNIELSDDTVVIDLGTFTELTGTLSPDVLSKINNAINENKNISIKAILDGTITFPNVIYGGDNLYCAGFLYAGNELNAVILNILLTTGQYVVGPVVIQEKLVSGTNIKTVNGQTILGEGNIEINVSGSSSSVFDITPYLTSQSSMSVEGYNAVREFVTSNKGGIIKITTDGVNYLYFSCTSIHNDTIQLSQCSFSGYEGSITTVSLGNDGIFSIAASDFVRVTPNPSNPTPNPTSILNTIGIGGSVYTIPTGGGGESNIPQLPADASTSTYVLKAVNGTIQWVKES